eukprot:gnl/TRDRNA2_/TRDRNA2_43241_c0_seq1.p1 gnl/TRDRNA2_/TRDRNA2_43241_c0~~gnl/TRDRNA2_/TRDRNA2_43241_c0_seq1.p1  ORF type:complete len:545 (+),score=69.26 gnl/TRDRNA2_/TRDRNA2_43241_c0_seq1:117-1751(+)
MGMARDWNYGPRGRDRRSDSRDHRGGQRNGRGGDDRYYASDRWRKSSRDGRDGRSGRDWGRRSGGRDGRDGRHYDQRGWARDARDRRQDRRSRSRSGRRRGDWSPRRGGSDREGRRAGGRWQGPSPRGGATQREGARGGGRDDRSESKSSASSESSSESDSRGSSDDDGGGKKEKKSGGDSDKDEIIHFSWQKGDLLNSRYEVSKLLGDGTFGRVLLVNDRCFDRPLAVKVIRDVKRYIENAKIEADILKDIRKADPQGTSRSAIMYETFMHDNKYFCLVFEVLGSSLYDFLKKNSFRGFFMQDIHCIAQQSLEALSFLHTRLQMTHTDLKPENILIATTEPPRSCDFPREASWLQTHKPPKGRASQYMRPASSAIKLIDFGNATYEDEHHSSIINTRQYRGPEVILSLGWNERSDIWSIGCILMELYTGELLFGTHENLEHMALMERALDPLPEKMLAEAGRSVKEKYLTESGGSWRLHWPERASSPSSERHVRSQKRLADLVEQHHTIFAQFVGYLLTADPAKRPTASEALKAKFFKSTWQD